MSRSTRRRRPARAFRPWAERCEPRQMLSAGAAASAMAARLPFTPRDGAPPVRPNTPVLPYGAETDVASFLDPTVRVHFGQRMVIGQNVLVAPYAILNAWQGFIRIGSGSSVEDNATVLANPEHQRGPTGVILGENVVVGSGATVRGPSTIGAFGEAAASSWVGPNAVVEAATIAPGAIVGALARVGPGVTVPSGLKVLPGRNVTTDTEAADPALGKVAPVTPEDLDTVATILANNRVLAAGYTELYQGNPLTGFSPGVPGSVLLGIFNGNLAAVTGSNLEAVPTLAPTRLGPQYITPRGFFVQGLFPDFTARVAGPAFFPSRPIEVERGLGRSNAIRADEGQAILIGPGARTGAAVTIRAPRAGRLDIGRDLHADTGAVVLGGPDVVSTLGDGVTIGPGAVVERSTLGAGSTIGERSYVLDSNLPPHSVVPARVVIIQDQVVGTVEW